MTLHEAPVLMMKATCPSISIHHWSPDAPVQTRIEHPYTLAVHYTPSGFVDETRHTAFVDEIRRTAWYDLQRRVSNGRPTEASGR